MDTNKTRILIVDDDESVAWMLSLILQQTGRYDARFETHADQTLEATRRFRPEVIVLDVMMPEMDGGDVAAQLRADPQTKDIPVIFITALVGNEESPMGGIFSAGHRFLPKPVSCVELTQCIEEVLDATSAGAAS
jgi:CheY-like chemotaxis protein